MDKVKLTVSKTYVKRSKLLSTESSCVDCGNPFKVSIEEYSKFKDKNIPLPTRCKACRRYKLIEIKLKKITKLIYLILDSKKKKTNAKPKLQKKPSKGNETQAKT